MPTDPLHASRCAWAGAVCRLLGLRATGIVVDDPPRGQELDATALVSEFGEVAVIRAAPALGLSGSEGLRALARAGSPLHVAPLSGAVLPTRPGLRCDTASGPIWFNATMPFLQAPVVRVAGERLRMTLMLPRVPGQPAVTSIGTVPATLLRESGEVFGGHFQHATGVGVFRPDAMQPGRFAPPTTAVALQRDATVVSFSATLAATPDVGPQASLWLLSAYSEPLGAAGTFGWVCGQPQLGLRYSPHDDDEATTQLIERARATDGLR